MLIFLIASFVRLLLLNLGCWRSATLIFVAICSARRLKSNLHYTRSISITPMRVTSSGIHLRDLALGQHSSEETSRFDRHESGNLTVNAEGDVVTL